MMIGRKKKLFPPMTAEQLRKNDRLLLLVAIIGLVFLIHNFYLSAVQEIPILGWVGYITGPIFSHKISEFLLIFLWGPVVWVSNYENANCYPAKMPLERYYKLLRISIFVAPIQIILSTYAWTIINFGTSAMTTNYEPLIFREDGWVWRYYLAILIIAGVIFVPFASQKVVKLSHQVENKKE